MMYLCVFCIGFCFKELVYAQILIKGSVVGIQVFLAFLVGVNTITKGSVYGSGREPECSCEARGRAISMSPHPLLQKRKGGCVRVRVCIHKVKARKSSGPGMMWGVMLRVFLLS